jgi:hypothetical protein
VQEHVTRASLSLTHSLAHSVTHSHSLTHPHSIHGDADVALDAIAWGGAAVGVEA